MAKKETGTLRGKRPRNASCSFCRKSYQDVGPLVEGPGEVSICGECIDLSQSIIEQEKRRRGDRPGAAGGPPLPAPEEVQRRLRVFVPGQEEASRSLATEVCRHFERLAKGIKDKAPQRAATPSFSPDRPRAASCWRRRRSPHLRRALRQWRCCHADGGQPFRSGHGFTSVQASGCERVRHGCGPERPCLRRWRGPAGLLPVPAAALGGTADYRLPHGFQMKVRNLLFLCGGRFEGVGEVVASRGRHPEQPLVAEDLIAWGMPSEVVRRFRAIVTVAPLNDDRLYYYRASTKPW